MFGAMEVAASLAYRKEPSEADESRVHRYQITKRTIDILISTFAVIALSPVLILICLGIPLTSSGPIFYKQIRVGKNEKHFKMWKFRTMVTNADKQLAAIEKSNEMHSGVLFKIKNDPRVTNIGRFLRRFSLDELPQIINILNGDMSVVGPRPALPNEVAQYDDRAKTRLIVHPGLTCFWQVSGRSELDFAEQIDLDLMYLKHQSLKTDLQIILKTFPAVLSARGAY